MNPAISISMMAGGYLSVLQVRCPSRACFSPCQQAHSLRSAPCLPSSIRWHPSRNEHKCKDAHWLHSMFLAVTEPGTHGCRVL